MEEASVAAIVAVADNGVIGRNNSLPWHLPEDLRYFKRITMGKPIIMGRQTWESIGRPLPGRTNIVVTRNPDYRAEGVRVVSSLPAAVELGRSVALIDGAQELMIIGGAQLYALAWPQVSRLYLTRVHAEVDGDAHLELPDLSGWRERSRQFYPASGNNPYDYSFLIFERDQSGIQAPPVT